jgi:serine/threonine protein kinase
MRRNGGQAATGYKNLGKGAEGWQQHLTIMNRACTVCERFSADGNLWCERLGCPVDELQPVLDYGEQFGEFKIIRLVRLLGASMLYEAEQQGDPVLLKIAHQGKGEFLKQEAALALKLVDQETGLIHLRPAYKASTTQAHPYGKAVLDRKTHYYAVYEHLQGEFLEDYLLKNPMPWYRDAAWITIQAARILSELHQRGGVVHAAPLRSALLIRHDHQNLPRPTLVDCGWMLPINSEAPAGITPAAGLPPELTRAGGMVTPSADVYSLARLLSEMLSGRGKAEAGSSPDRNVSLADALGRTDLPQSGQVGAILRQAFAAEPRQRQQSVPEFAGQLVGIFGKPPPYTNPGLLNALLRKADWGTLAFAGMMAFLLFIILILALNRG